MEINDKIWFDKDETLDNYMYHINFRRYNLLFFYELNKNLSFY